MDFSNTQEQITPQSLVTCKYEEDPIKIESARVATTLNIDFSNTQGKITPRSGVGSGGNSNSFEMF